jgi:peroxiredoxin Q/BCP
MGAFLPFGASEQNSRPRVFSSVKIGDIFPPFILPDQNGKPFDLSQLLGKQALVVFFYPKDHTAGCTAQACAFRDAYEDFVDAGADVIGISSDSHNTHLGFSEKYRLPFTLLSDVEGKIRRKLRVPKSLGGLLPGRLTYVIDQNSVIRYIFASQLKPKAHIQNALDIINKLNQEK